ncbi:hypothetical protein EJ07DRAFT_156462 [Lizonia empirigonia]|nr:hypothetical protein EJ07DRAFT_156462 [Lizonia empirigonia]
MSLLHRDGPRRFSRPTSARTFPETYYNERHAPIDYNQADPYAYPMGGPVSSLRARSRMDREEFQIEPTGSRRRIAVAVGSDHVHTVMDNLTMAQSLTSMATGQEYLPLYSGGGTLPDLRPMQNQQYHQVDVKSRYPQLIDTKPAYNSEWTTPCGGDTSPDENYSFDQSSLYPPASTTAGAASLDNSSYRWANHTARSMQPVTSYYSDYGNSYIASGLPYLQTDMHPSAAAEPISPLSMSSLHITLPERPRQRQLQPTEVPLTPCRRLPAPQPHPSHGLHHALDQQQDQRLRSSHTVATPSFTNVSPFTKPLLPWTTANENLLNAINETTTAAMPPPLTSLAPLDTLETVSNFIPTTTSSDDTASSKARTPSMELNFHTKPLLDPSTLNAPITSAYSNFRGSRDSACSSTQLPRGNSSSSQYTYGSALRQPSFTSDCPSDNLVSGNRYSPLSQPTDTPTMVNITRESFERRASMSNLTSSF